MSRVVVAVLAAVLTTGCARPASPPTPSTPVVTSSAVALSPTPDGPEVSPMPEPVLGPDEFLRRLRAAGVAVSVSGSSEVTIGRAVCGRLATGLSPEDVATELNAGIVVWDATQAMIVVNAAVETLCP